MRYPQSYLALLFPLLLTLSTEVSSAKAQPFSASLPHDKPARRNVHGDPLPPGAVARLGTSYLRHDGYVSYCAYLPDGRFLVSAGADYTVRVWDTTTRREVRRINLEKETPGEEVYFSAMPVAVSADGKTLATAFNSRKIFLWDVTTGKQLRPLHPRQGQSKGHVIALAFAPRGDTLAALDTSATIHLWNLTDGKPRPEIKAGFRVVEGYASGLVFSPDGKAVVSTFNSGINRQIQQCGSAWEVASGKKIAVYVCDPRSLWCHPPPVFSPDGTILAWPGEENTILLTDITGKQLRECRAENGLGYPNVLFCPDGKTLISRVSHEQTFRRWDVATGKELEPKAKSVSAIKPPPGLIGDIPAALALSPEGETLACAHGHAIELFDFKTGQRRLSRGHQRTIRRVGYAPDGKSLFTWGLDQTLRFWDPTTAQETRKVQIPGGFFACKALSFDGRLLAYHPQQGQVRLWDATTEKEVLTLQRGVASLTDMAFSWEGKILALQNRGEEQIELYSMSTGLRLQSIQLPRSESPRRYPLGPLLFSPDSRYLAAPSGSKSLSVWDIASGREQYKLDCPLDWRLHGKFSPDGRMLAAMADVRELRVWELATGTERCRLRPKGGQPRQANTWNFGTLAFSSDSRLLAQAGSGGVIYLWDVTRGQEISRLEGHQSAIRTLVFSPDGKILVSGSTDTTALIWDVNSLGSRSHKPNSILTAKELQTHWENLSSENGNTAYQSLCAMIQAPQKSVPFLQQHLRTASPEDVKRIRQLITALDSRSYAVRQRTQQELADLGKQVEPALRQLLADKPTLEVRWRVQALLEQITDRQFKSEQARVLRAVEILERINNIEATRLLHTLARGAPETLATSEAKAGLKRLGEKPSPANDIAK